MGHLDAILVIEDDQVLQRATRRLMERAFGAVVLVVGTVDDAVGVLGAIHFDLVLSDFDIVGGTGGDVFDWLRENQPRQLDQFVFFTGNDAARAYSPRVVEKGQWPAAVVEQIRGHLASVCPAMGPVGHVHPGPSYARAACACGKEWQS